MSQQKPVSFDQSTGTGAIVPGPTIPNGMLCDIAARLRCAGLFIGMLHRDGTAAWCDFSGAEFFQRYVWRALLDNPSINATLKNRTSAMSATAEVLLGDFVPGVAVAIFPYVERRHILGLIVLAGRALEPADVDAESRKQEIVEICNQLQLDGRWFIEQSDALPIYSPAALRAQAQLVVAMMRDQIRVAGLEQELTSLSGQLANTYEELSLIYQVSSGMRITRGAAEFFRQACHDVLQVMGMGAIGVAVRGEKPDTWEYEPTTYGRDAFDKNQADRISRQVMADLQQRKGPLLINDIAHDPHFAWAADFARQLIAVPLQRQDKVLGCLFGINKTGSEFDSADSKLLNSIANESAIYLENARLYGDVRDLMMGMLHSLTSAVDAKDAYTLGHSERVASLSRRLATQAKLADAQIDRVYMAGLLHDVGKIGVPEHVLQKTGRLSTEEFEQMKKHPQIGAHILSDIKQVQDIIPGVLYHHERYDGKGYPQGLVGQNVPVMGRIICLADCFDAMTSNRTYRRALPLEVALNEIRRCAGTQFDPALTEFFLQITPQELRSLLRDHHQMMQTHLKAA